MNARELVPRLEAALAEVSNKRTGFGGELMDPRVATHYAESPRAAVAALLREWSAAPRKKQAR